jgi:hypothetical protein
VGGQEGGGEGGIGARLENEGSEGVEVGGVEVGRVEVGRVGGGLEEVRCEREWGWGWQRRTVRRLPMRRRG